MSLQVKYLNGGYCRHPLASIDGRTLRLVRFHAVFLAMLHPRLGWVVCDTGYGSSFFDATQRWPFRLYRWATPVTLQGAAAQALATIGVRADEVEHLIITHFHADHVGGMREFPNATVYYHEHALAPLAASNPLRQTRAAFLPSLVPGNLASRSSFVPSKAFVTDSSLPFDTYDLFGDGLIKLVYLPGHAPGQVGLEYFNGAARTLYCADAYWRSIQIQHGVDLPWPVQALQWDSVAYRTTIGNLRELAKTGTHHLLACHDEETQQHVAA